MEGWELLKILQRRYTDTAGGPLCLVGNGAEVESWGRTGPGVAVRGRVIQG